MRIAVGLSAFWLVVAMAASVAVRPVAAHEDDLVGDGRYEVIVGFLVEPAFVGEKNGLQLYVAKLPSLATPEPGDATPVAADEVFDRPIEGLETSLRAEVAYGDQRLALPLEPVLGVPGEYVSYFFPTAEGDYGFRLFGTIEGTAVDETFTSSPDGFNAVQPRVDFPVATTAGAASDASSVPVVAGVLALVGTVVGGLTFGRRRYTS